MLPRISMECVVVMEPEIRFGDNGKAWGKVRVVAKDRKRGANGAWEDGDKTFLTVTTFGLQAENLAESCQVGDTLIVEGALQQRDWEADDGTKRTSYEVVVDFSGHIGVSLRWNAQRKHDTRTAPATDRAQEDPWASQQEPPF